MKTVLITGAYSGVGNQLVNKFLNENYKIVALDIKDIEEKENLLFYNCNITDDNRLNEIKKDLNNKNIIFDLIINVAGIHKMASLVESDNDVLKSVINVNLVVVVINVLLHLVEESIFIYVFVYR